MSMVTTEASAPALPQARPDLMHLIERMAAGDVGARDRLFATAYGELRKLARARLRDGGRDAHMHTTALVHESYLRFLNASQLRIQDRRAFFAYASQVMRSVIIDAVRERQAQRRGGDVEVLTLDTQAKVARPTGEFEIMHVHDALLALEQAEPRLAKVVEMRYFGGYTEAEIAQTLAVTQRTVRRDWAKARLILWQSLKS